MGSCYFAEVAKLLSQLQTPTALHSSSSNISIIPIFPTLKNLVCFLQEHHLSESAKNIMLEVSLYCRSIKLFNAGQLLDLQDIDDAGNWFEFAISLLAVGNVNTGHVDHQQNSLPPSQLVTFTSNISNGTSSEEVVQICPYSSLHLAERQLAKYILRQCMQNDIIVNCIIVIFISIAVRYYNSCILHTLDCVVPLCETLELGNSLL